MTTPKMINNISLGNILNLVALAEAGFITEAEGRDWLRGNDLPALASAMIATLPANQRLRTEAKLLRMQSAYRLDETTLALAEAKRQSMDPQPTPEEMAEAVDAIFGWS